MKGQLVRDREWRAEGVCRVAILGRAACPATMLIAAHLPQWRGWGTVLCHSDLALALNPLAAPVPQWR